MPPPPPEGTSAEAALRRYEDRMARALASVINVLDPDVIVLGGGLSNLNRLYDAVPRLWRAHVFSEDVATRLVRARHGDASGAAMACRRTSAIGQGVQLKTHLDCEVLAN